MNLSLLPCHAALAALSAIGFTAHGQAAQDSVALLQSAKNGAHCLICECTKGPATDEQRCIGTAFDKLMLHGRISSEKMLASLVQEKTHACKDVQNAIRGDDTVEEVMADFEKHFGVSFDLSKEKFRDVKKLYNQFARAVAAELSDAGSPHVGTAFDSCLELADADIDHFEGLMDIGASVFHMTPSPEVKVERLQEMIRLSLNFIGRFRDQSYICFKDLAYGVTELLANPPTFMMSVVRLGLHFDVVAMEAAEEEAIVLHTELECMGNKVGISVAPFADPSVQEESNDEIDLPVNITKKADGGKSMPEDDFPDLPESLKQLARPRPKRRTTASLERLIADLPEMRKMLNPRQNKLLDEAIALAKGDPVPATNETEVAN